MKIKLGPVEIEQDPIKDELLYNEYKESPKIVEKYLVEITFGDCGNASSCIPLDCSR